MSKPREPITSIDVYGWYDRAHQAPDQPSYDPPHDAPCLFCDRPIHDGDVRTISLMAMPETGPMRAYFYRVHRSCHVAATCEAALAVDGKVWDLIKADKGGSLPR
jgi:hypothetical protein